jgi:hypothetical protein
MTNNDESERALSGIALTLGLTLSLILSDHRLAEPLELRALLFGEVVDSVAGDFVEERVQFTRFAPPRWIDARGKRARGRRGISACVETTSQASRRRKQYRRAPFPSRESCMRSPRRKRPTIRKDGIHSRPANSIREPVKMQAKASHLNGIQPQNSANWDKAWQRRSADPR